MFLLSQELKYQLFLNLLQAISVSIDNMLAPLMTLVNISFFIEYAHQPLFPRFLVFTLGFYMRLCYSIGFQFSRTISTLINGLVSAKRINDFLLAKELATANEKCFYGETASIKVENLDFSWNQVNELKLN